MRFRNFVLACVFLSFVAVGNLQAQFQVNGWITGRVVTPSGAGVRRATVYVLNLNNLENQTRTTNDFGYFRFNDLSIMDLYVVTVNGKRNFFRNSSQLVQFTAIEYEMTFISDY